MVTFDLKDKMGGLNMKIKELKGEQRVPIQTHANDPIYTRANYPTHAHDANYPYADSAFEGATRRVECDRW